MRVVCARVPAHTCALESSDDTQHTLYKRHALTRAHTARAQNAGEAGQGRHLAPLTSRQKRVVAALVDAHGDDYAAMARDLRRNPLQHTPAKLRTLCLSYAATKHQTIGLGGARPTKAQLTTFHPKRRF